MFYDAAVYLLFCLIIVKKFVTKVKVASWVNTSVCREITREVTSSIQTWQRMNN